MKSVKSLRPVNRPRAYELAAEQIKQMIRAGTWSLGERIPAERELAEQLAISRGTTREALRALEAMGWIAVRPGEGAIVRDPTSVSFVSSVFGEPSNQLARLGELWEARKLIEPHAAYLAAERRSEDALGALEATIHRMIEKAEQNRWHAALDENPKFHLAVASAAENAMIEHIQRLLNEASDQATRSLRPAATPDRVHKVIREHQEICDAIRAGDAARAQSGGFEHLMTSWMAEWSRKPDARG